MSRFDRIILGVVLGALLLATLLIWRGDRVGLRITAVAPAEDATDVSTRTELHLTFDQPIRNPDAATVTITPPISGTVRWEGEQRLIFRPALPLQPDTAYTVTLSGELLGERGARLQRDYRWAFRTRPRHILYLSEDAAGIIQLYRVPTVEDAAATPIVLTDEPVGVVDYAIDPAGERIVYTAERADGGTDLWLIGHDGGERQQLLDCGGHNCRGATWSPDGERVVYELQRRVASEEAPTLPRLWWLELATRETAPVFDDETWYGAAPRLSPDGRWLSYIAPTTEEVQSYNLESGRAFIVPSGSGDPADWAPDSAAFLVTAIEIEGTSALVRTFHIDVDTGELRNISGEISVDDRMPDWSPDGSQIAVARTIPRTPAGRQLVVMRPDGSEVRRLTDDLAVQHSRPRWSVDGRYLLFERIDTATPAPMPAIWQIDVTTGAQRELAPAGFDAQWLP